jgi:hypothetical protein
LNVGEINSHTKKRFRPWHDGIRVSNVVSSRCSNRL